MSVKVMIDGKSYAGVDQIDVGGKSLVLEAESVTPSGTKTITENGTYDVSEYAQAEVNVASGGNSDEDDKYLSVLENVGPIGAFEDSKLNKVRAYAFYGCSQMTSLRLDNVTGAYGYAFQSCGIQSASLPKCTSLGDYAFQGCKVLSSVDIPLVETLKSNVFYQCVALTEISLPKCTSIELNAFGFCTSLTKLTLGSETMCVLADVSAFRNIGTTITVEVPAALVDTYKADSMWSTVTGATLEFVAMA